MENGLEFAPYLISHLTTFILNRYGVKGYFQRIEYKYGYCEPTTQVGCQSSMAIEETAQKLGTKKLSGIVVGAHTVEAENEIKVALGILPLEADWIIILLLR